MQLGAAYQQLSADAGFIGEMVELSTRRQSR